MSQLMKFLNVTGIKCCESKNSKKVTLPEPFLAVYCVQ